MIVLRAHSSCTYSVFRTILLVPSILKRIDDQLLVKELNMLFFRRTIQESALLTALTPPSASVQFDYERLELFGAHTAQCAFFNLY